MRIKNEGKGGEVIPVKLGGRGWGRSQIIGPQESLVIYKLFNTL
jgi:hypothetical protein